LTPGRRRVIRVRSSVVRYSGQELSGPASPTNFAPARAQQLVIRQLASLGTSGLMLRSMTLARISRSKFSRIISAGLAMVSRMLRKSMFQARSVSSVERLSAPESPIRLVSLSTKTSSSALQQITPTCIAQLPSTLVRTVRMPPLSRAITTMLLAARLKIFCLWRRETIHGRRSRLPSAMTFVAKAWHWHCLRLFVSLEDRTA
jgi:hypothetical protein